MNNDYVYLAKIGKTVGLQGYLRLIIDTDFPEQFKKKSTFVTNKNIELKVLDYDFLKQLIKFEGYEDIELAKKLTNQEIYTTLEKTKQNCKLGKNEFFWFDLISCEVFENNLKLGIVKNLNRYPLNDYLEIETSRELVKENNLPKLFLIPFIFDKFILYVDLKCKKIEVINSFGILQNS